MRTWVEELFEKVEEGKLGVIVIKGNHLDQYVPPKCGCGEPAYYVAFGQFMCRSCFTKTIEERKEAK